MSTNSQQQSSETDLKEALEYQIDIVLRLEEERLLLLKENKIQKQKIKELSTLVNKYTAAEDNIAARPRSIRDATSQTDFDLALAQRSGANQRDVGAQTVEEVSCVGTTTGHNVSQTISELDENDSALLQYSHLTVNQGAEKEETPSEILKQAQTLLKKEVSQQKTATSSAAKEGGRRAFPINKSKLAPKELHFVSSQQGNSGTGGKKTSARDTRGVPQDKENDNNEHNASYQLEKTITSNVDEKEFIAQELVKLTREQNLMRKEQRKMEEAMKKKDKDSAELRKQIDIKNEMLERLRKELAELSLIMNNDKFKSLRTVESELRKAKEQCKEARDLYAAKAQEKELLDNELQQFRSILERLTGEYDRLQQRSQDVQLQQDVRAMRVQVGELERKLEMRTQELALNHSTIEEMKQQNQKMEQEVEFFKNLSRTSKEHADKAVADIEFYRNVIKQNGIALH